MRYADLVQFDPIDTLVRLEGVEERDRLAPRTVISHDIARTLADRVIPRLRLREGDPGGGVLVVGARGTGKSHLLTLLTAVAESDDALSALTHEPGAESLTGIAGDFRVLRIALTPDDPPLPDVLVDRLVRYLAEEGIGIDLPAPETPAGLPDYLTACAEAHAGKHPRKGLLLVVDDLRPTPSASDGPESTGDMPVLARLGALSARGPLRVLAGATAWLVDLDEQPLAGDFTLLRIGAEDIKRVVSRRMVPKTPEQWLRVQSYLARFGPFLSDITDRLQEYADLFPIHPDFMDVFAGTLPDEAPPVLPTLSASVAKVIRETVPQDYPGLVAYDDWTAEDLEGKIERRADTLNTAALDRYYYEALKRAMECTYDTYVASFRIWEHELEWHEHHTTRSGYLVFGTPGDRGEGIPERDFHLYFLPPTHTPEFTDEKRPDETFLHLKKPDDVFWWALRRFGAAMDLAANAGTYLKSIYELRSDEYLKELLSWLNDHIGVAYELTYQGRTRTLLRWSRGLNIRELGHIPPEEKISFREMMNTISAICLSGHFADQAPAYPYFPILISGAERVRAAQDAVRWIAAENRTRRGAAVLSALDLLDGEFIDPIRSRYAKWVLDMVDEKEPGAAVKRSEILTRQGDAEYMAPETMRLEPEWVAVLVTALVYSGDLILVIPGKRFDATNLLDMAARPVGDLIRFEHVERFRGWNLAAIRELFGLFAQPPGQAHLLVQGNSEPLETLRREADEVLWILQEVAAHLRAGMPFWGEPMLGPPEIDGYQDRLLEIRTFLENVKSYTTPGELQHFRYDVRQIHEFQKGFASLEELSAVRGIIDDLERPADYLTTARAILPEAHEWIRGLDAARSEIRAGIRDPLERDAPDFVDKARQTLRGLKRAFIDLYMRAHAAARLDPGEEKRLRALKEGAPLKALARLSTLPQMPARQVEAITERLEALRACHGLTAEELRHSALCPRCGFRPCTHDAALPADTLLPRLEAEIHDLTESWAESLAALLSAPAASRALSGLPSEQRSAVAALLENRKLPGHVDETTLAALRSALAPLKKRTVRLEQLADVLLAGGSPASPEALKQRFDTLLAEVVGGGDPETTRIEISR